MNNILPEIKKTKALVTNVHESLGRILVACDRFVSFGRSGYFEERLKAFDEAWRGVREAMVSLEQHMHTLQKSLIAYCYMGGSYDNEQD